MAESLTPNQQFWLESHQNIQAMSEDKELQQLIDALYRKLGEYRWVYNFSWMGRPMIALPTDIYAFQELVWRVKPDLIIETGIAHGGSLVLWASLLELLGGDGMAVGIDIDIRKHNRVEIESHPMFKRITMLEGSSVDSSIIAQVYKLAEGRHRIMVVLDSNHTHEHVLAEMQAYGRLVTPDFYMIVCDTIVEQYSESADIRPWGKGNNPYTAVQTYLSAQKDLWTVDVELERKLLLTCAPSGWLRRK